MSYPPTPSSRERNLVDFVRRKRWVRRRRRQQISPGVPLGLSECAVSLDVFSWQVLKPPCGLAFLGYGFFVSVTEGCCRKQLSQILRGAFPC